MTAHHPELAEKSWTCGPGCWSVKRIKRRSNAIKMGFLRLPREWVMAAGPQLPKTRRPHTTRDGRYAMRFLSDTQLMFLAQRGFSPAEVLATVDLHPAMRQYAPGLDRRAWTQPEVGADGAHAAARTSIDGGASTSYDRRC